MNRIAFLQLETQTYSRSITFAKHVKSMYDEIDYYQLLEEDDNTIECLDDFTKLYVSDKSALIETLRQYTTIILNADKIVKYNLGTGVFWINGIKDLQCKFVVINHHDLSTVNDSILGELTNFYKMLSDANRLEYWSSNSNSVSIIKNIAPNIVVKELKLSSMVMADGSSIGCPFCTDKDKITVITKNTKASIYNDLVRLKTRRNINVILASYKSSVDSLNPSFSYYVNINDDNIKDYILNHSKLVITGTSEENLATDYTWSICEAICHGCIPVVPIDYKKLLDEFGVYAEYYYSDKDIASQLDEIINKLEWSTEKASMNYYNFRNKILKDWSDLVDAFNNILGIDSHLSE